MYQIDLNSDMGESFGAYSIGNDDEIIKYVTTANVACGWHGGDPMVMDKVVKKPRRERWLWVPIRVIRILWDSADARWF